MQSRVLGAVTLCCALLPLLSAGARLSISDDLALKALEAENDLLRRKTSALIDQITMNLYRNRGLPSHERDSVTDILVLLQEEHHPEQPAAKGMISNSGLAQAVHTMLRKQERRRDSRLGVQSRGSSGTRSSAWADNDNDSYRLLSRLQERSASVSAPPTSPDPPQAAPDTDPAAPPVADTSGNVAPFSDAPNSVVKDLKDKMKDGMKTDALAQAATDQANSPAAGGVGDEAAADMTKDLRDKLKNDEISPEEFQSQVTSKLAEKPGARGLSCDAEHDMCKTKAKDYLEFCVKGHRLATYKAGTARYIRRESSKITVEMEAKYQTQGEGETPDDQTGGEAAAAPADADNADVSPADVGKLADSIGAGADAGPEPGAESPLEPSPSSKMQQQMVQDALKNMNKGMMGGG